MTDNYYYYGDQFTHNYLSMPYWDNATGQWQSVQPGNLALHLDWSTYPISGSRDAMGMPIYHMQHIRMLYLYALMQAVTGYPKAPLSAGAAAIAGYSEVPISPITT